MTTDNFFSIEFKQRYFFMNRSKRIYSDCDFLLCVVDFFMFALLFFLRLEYLIYEALGLECFL